MENFKRITQGQVKQIALEISKRWKFVNYGNYYNCIDTKTNQQSISGGDYNFASYHFQNKIESQYLKLINENSLYFDWSQAGVKVTEERKMYLLKVRYKVIHILCGFVSDSSALKEIYN